MEKQIKIMNWNANGVLVKRNELHYFASDHDVDIVLLTETHLSTRHPKFSIPNYMTYRTDRPLPPGTRRPGGGTAVLVHRRLTHRPVPLLLARLEATAVAIQAQGSEILIAAAYCPPTSPLLPQDLDTIMNTQDNVVLGGDLNAKHPTWHSRLSTTKGRRLRQYVNQRQDTEVIGPTEPTHYPTHHGHRADVLDVFVVQGTPLPMSVRVVNDLSSDHVPVLLTVDATPAARLNPPSATVRTEWNGFHSLLAGRLQPLTPAADPEQLDSQVDDLTQALVESLAAATRPAKPKDTRSALPQNIRDELAQKRRLRRAWQHTRDPAVKRLFNQQCSLVKQLLYDYRSSTWDSYLASLDLDDNSAWKAAKVLRGTKPTSTPLHGQRGMAYSAEAKAEAFADSMEDQFQPHPDVYDDDHTDAMEEFAEDFFSIPPEDHLEPFTLEEVEEAIANAKPRKAPGHDRVGARALQAAPPLLAANLHCIFNSALRFHHFPSNWKTAKVILFPKPGKDHLFPQNYRPISLLSIISKIFERLLLQRLTPFLEHHIRPEQFGFRRGHSTTLQLTRVITELADNANRNRATAAVMLDVSKAFDRVWHPGLLFKLSESPLPRAAVHLLKSYLSDRRFHTSVDGVNSSERMVEAGVPQGSVLGPALYLVYTNDLPLLPEVSLALYADDAMLMASSNLPARAAAIMQQQMHTLSPWLTKWRIAVNTEKSEAIVFKKFHRMPRALPPLLH